MSNNPDQNETKKLSLAERAKRARKEQYEKAKERQRAYLASPEVQKKLQEKKDKLKQIRKEKADAMKLQKKTASREAKKALDADLKATREKKQVERDAELQGMVKPALTLIQGGALK